MRSIEHRDAAGLLHRVDGPAQTVVSQHRTTELYYHRGRLHRIAGPANVAPATAPCAHYPEGLDAVAEFFVRGRRVAGLAAVADWLDALPPVELDAELANSELAVAAGLLPPAKLVDCIRYSVVTIELIREVANGVPVDWAGGFALGEEAA